MTLFWAINGDDLLWSINGNELTGGSGADVFGIAHETPEHAEGFVLEPTVITDFDGSEDTISVQFWCNSGQSAVIPVIQT